MTNKKSILLTGATSGIGLGVLNELVNQENIVFAVGRNFELIINLYGDNNPYIYLIKSDLNNISNIVEIFDIIESKGVKLDCFINCAGYEETIPLKQYDNQKVMDIFKINVFSSIEILKYFSLKKYSNDGSSVVLVSSVMGNLGQSGKIGYCASKASINGLVKASALELSKRKIRVNSVSPGVVKTKMTKKLFEEVGIKSEEQIINMHPLGLGEVEDVVPAIVFLGIGNSKWITGIDLVVDGGYSAK